MRLYRVREAAQAADCPFTEYRLRLMIAAGRCPGVMVGNRFMIDLDALIAQTKEESRAAVKRGGAAE